MEFVNSNYHNNVQGPQYGRRGKRNIEPDDTVHETRQRQSSYNSEKIALDYSPSPSSGATVDAGQSSRRQANVNFAYNPLTLTDRKQPGGSTSAVLPRSLNVGNRKQRSGILRGKQKIAEDTSSSDEETPKRRQTGSNQFSPENVLSDTVGQTSSIPRDPVTAALPEFNSATAPTSTSNEIEASSSRQPIEENTSKLSNDPSSAYFKFEDSSFQREAHEKQVASFRSRSPPLLRADEPRSIRFGKLILDAPLQHPLIQDNVDAYHSNESSSVNESNLAHHNPFLVVDSQGGTQPTVFQSESDSFPTSGLYTENQDGGERAFSTHSESGRGVMSPDMELQKPCSSSQDLIIVRESLQSRDSVAASEDSTTNHHIAINFGSDNFVYKDPGGVVLRPNTQSKPNLFSCSQPSKIYRGLKVPAFMSSSWVEKEIQETSGGTTQRSTGGEGHAGNALTLPSPNKPEQDASQDPKEADVSSPPSTPMCRICFGEGSADNPLISMGCLCKGDMSRIHHECMMTWYEHSAKKACEICGQDLGMLAGMKTPQLHREMRARPTPLDARWYQGPEFVSYAVSCSGCCITFAVVFLGFAAVVFAWDVWPETQNRSLLLVRVRAQNKKFDDVKIVW